MIEQPCALPADAWPPCCASILNKVSISWSLAPSSFAFTFNVMAEIFATVASVASSIDVALRACNALYDSIQYLKDTPQLSQRLRQTIQNVKSALENLQKFGATYRQQQISAGLPDFLPSAVNNGINSIKAELDHLSTLLPSSSSSGQLRSKVKWVLDRKEVNKVTQALDSHQNTLKLALQAFAL